MGESATPLPNELTKNLSYPKRAELVKKFPHGDPDKFAITVAHVREGDFDEKPAHRVNISQPFYMARRDALASLRSSQRDRVAAGRHGGRSRAIWMKPCR